MALLLHLGCPSTVSLWGVYQPLVSRVPAETEARHLWRASCAGTPRRTRTPNLLVRSQTLYPIELWARAHSGGEGGIRTLGTVTRTTA